MSDSMFSYLIKYYSTIYTHEVVMIDRDMLIEACGFLRCMYYISSQEQREYIKNEWHKLTLLYMPFHDV